MQVLDAPDDRSIALDAALPKILQLTKQHRYEEALFLIDEVQVPVPMKPDPWIRRTLAAERGDIYAAADDMENAVRWYKRAQDAPHFNFGLNQHAMARLFVQHGNYEWAIQELETGIRIGQEASPHYLLELFGALLEYSKPLGLKVNLEYLPIFEIGCRTRGISTNYRVETDDDFERAIVESIKIARLYNDELKRVSTANRETS